MTAPSKSNSSSPFHEGEIALQRSVDMAERLERVGHSFGKCPKYFHRRSFKLTRRPEIEPEWGPEELAELDEPARKLIATADTFFVASYVDREEGIRIDASHRGGNPGFAKVDHEGAQRIWKFRPQRIIIHRRRGPLPFSAATTQAELD